jgi:hypothetical protein
MVKHRQGTTFIGITYVCSYEDDTIINLNDAVVTTRCSYDGVDKDFTVGSGLSNPSNGQFTLLAGDLIDWEVGQWRVTNTVKLSDGFTFKIDDIIWVTL